MEWNKLKDEDELFVLFLIEFVNQKKYVIIESVEMATVAFPAIIFFCYYCLHDIKKGD